MYSHSPEKSTILVTGATGFIGSRFIKEFKDKLNIKTFSLSKEKIEDISFNGINAVLHTAALVHQTPPKPDDEYFYVNYELTCKLAERAKSSGVSHFIFLSTSHVYGEFAKQLFSYTPLTETTKCSPSDAYGKSKLMAEQKLLEMSSDDFKVSIIRIPMVYGTGAKGNINALVKLVKYFPILPFDYDLNKRSVIHVSNLAHFINSVVLAKKTGIFLAQDAEPVSIKQLILYIANAQNKKVFLIKLSPLVLKVLKFFFPNPIIKLYGSLAFESHLTNKSIGYTPVLSSQDGVKEMINLLK